MGALRGKYRQLVGAPLVGALCGLFCRPDCDAAALPAPGVDEQALRLLNDYRAACCAVSGPSAGMMMIGPVSASDRRLLVGAPLVGALRGLFRRPDYDATALNSPGLIYLTSHFSLDVT